MDGAFIVNIGELLEYATRGYLRATEHRVNLGAPAPERISVPYFFNPRLDAQMPVLSLPDELAAHVDSGWTPAADPSDRIFSVYGRNAWKSRLRAHPDVVDGARILGGYRRGREFRAIRPRLQGAMKSGELIEQADADLTA